MDTELVLDMTHIDATVALVVDEHRQTAAILGAFLRTGQHEVDVGVTVGDEALHTIEAPCTVGILRSLQHDMLKVGAGIGFGKVHRHGLTGADAGNVLGLLLGGTELIQRVDTALQRPYILETGVGSRDEL